MELIKGLSRQEIEKFKKSTEDIIANVGFYVDNKEILQKCRKAGAKVDDARNNVRISPEMLRELLATVPSQYKVCWQDGSEHTIGGEKQRILSIVTDPWIIDYETQKPRKPCLEDMRKHTIIAQKTEDVVTISRMDYPVTDVQGTASSLRALEEHLVNHNKHIFVIVTSMESYNQWMEIGEILSQGRGASKSKLFSVAVAAVSPLTLVDFNAEILLHACKNNLPVVPTICPMAGTTSPYSMAGTLLVGNAENVMIAGLSQILNPGNPFTYACGVSVTNMRSGHDMYYTIDKVLWKLAGIQMAKAYNMPSSTECGGTMTYRYDQQNGAEGVLFMLTAVNSGVSILAGLGSCYNAVGMSAEMMIIQKAWIDVARYLARGINTDDLYMGMESIKNVGPGGNFITDELTLKLLRENEFFSNETFDFSGDYERGPSLLERAHAKVEEITAGYKSPVPEKTQNELRRYFEKEYGKLT